MELILLIAFLVLLIVVGIMKLWQSATADNLSHKHPLPVYMSEALDVNDELTSALGKKMYDRSIEIAKADGRFLVTPADMKQAYEEIIREEHM